MAVYLIGTSNAIVDGGYATYLAQGLANEGVPFINLSVGDQTSIMGYMRLQEVLAGLSDRDVVVWEYPLLDALLTEAGIDPDLVVMAACAAWGAIREHNARLILVEITPRPALLGERQYAILDQLKHRSRAFGACVIDVAEIMASLFSVRADWKGAYSDDRHLVQYGAVSERLGITIKDAVLSPEPDDEGCHANEARGNGLSLRWLNFRALSERTAAASAVLESQTYTNSLLSIEALLLPADTGAIYFPDDEVALIVGFISTPGSGFLWCGHHGCPPFSTRLPNSLSRFRFLLRSSRVPCLRVNKSRELRTAPDWILKGALYADYGQSPEAQVGDVAITGVITERPVRVT